MPSLTYHTEAIVLHYFDAGEADRIYVVFSEKFGMLRLFAKSIRMPASKLRGHMALFSHNRISFVLGRSLFRLIDAEEKRSCAFSHKQFFLAGRLSAFLLRVVQGEEQDIRVWNVLLSAWSALLAKKDNSNRHDTFVSFEILFRVRVLHALGYVGEHAKHIEKFLSSSDWNLPVPGNEKTALHAIAEKGIHASHL